MESSSYSVSAIATFTVALLSVALMGGCTSTTHTVDRYPSPSAPEHNTEAFTAADGSNNPAGPSDAGFSLAAGLIDTALLGSRRVSASSLPSRELIRGRCEIEHASAPTPCTSFGLIVEDLQGNVLTRLRTSQTGEFAFAALADAPGYRVVANSARYVTESTPAAPLHVGTMVLLTLKAR